MGETDPRGRASPPSIIERERFGNGCESLKDYTKKVFTKLIPVCYTGRVNIRKAKARKREEDESNQSPKTSSSPRAIPKL